MTLSCRTIRLTWWPRHPDRAQHPELARPLEHAEDERVHHPEDAHDHGEREQDVEHDQEVVEVLVLLVDPCLARLHLRVREVGERSLEPVLDRSSGSPLTFTNVNWFCGRS